MAAGSTAKVRDGHCRQQAIVLTRIAIRRGKSSKFKRALMDEIYEAMRETIQIEDGDRFMTITTIQIEDGDRFMTITERSATEFTNGSLLSIERSDDFVQIQIFWAPGKTAEGKLAMYNAIVERLGRNPGVRPERVLICVVETPPENWSFGNDEAPLSKVQPDDPIRAR
jgi:phenylpyruvate tautomerase PptA (4-oxalocrotonate tautomerase family)